MVGSFSRWGIALTWALMVACGGDATGESEAPGATSSGGTGGSVTGGTTSGGTGGSVTGGTTSGGTGGSGTGATGGTSSGATGGVTTGGAPSGGAETGGTAPIGGGGGMMGCFVAVQLDDCCSAPIPADSLVVGNPCLRAYGEQHAPEVYDACPQAELCLSLNCVHPAPASRVVSRRAEGCVFVDECVPSDIDCRVAIDHNRCCSCPEVIPRIVVEVDPCVVEVGQPAPTGCADCSAVDCAVCNAPAPVPACGYRGDPPLGICSAGIR